MKKVILILSVFLLVLFLTPAVFAEDAALIDDAQLLTAGERESLEAILEDCAQATGLDVMVVTVESLDGEDIEVFSRDVFGRPRDGVMLLISMDEREWHILTCDGGKERLPDRELRRIEKAFVSLLSDEDYFGAFEAFSESVTTYANTDYHSPAGWFVCIGVGITIGFVVVLILKGQLKSVRPQRSAANYIVDGSFNLTQSNEFFLYRNVTRVQKSSSSSGGSSSGGSFGGRSGKF